MYVKKKRPIYFAGYQVTQKPPDKQWKPKNNLDVLLMSLGVSPNSQAYLGRPNNEAEMNDGRWSLIPIHGGELTRTMNSHPNARL